MSKISLNTFSNTVNQMTNDGLRDSSPFWNNQERDWGKLTGDLLGDSKKLIERRSTGAFIRMQ
jgi:hypothetical protein